MIRVQSVFRKSWQVMSEGECRQIPEISDWVRDRWRKNESGKPWILCNCAFRFVGRNEEIDTLRDVGARVAAKQAGPRRC